MTPSAEPRIVFAGSPAFAAASLARLLTRGWNVVGALCQPDSRAGRGRRRSAPAVKTLAAAHGLPVQQPPTLRTPEAREALAALEPDVMVVAAYGLLLPRAVLELPIHGCLNVHASLLPRWRGAAPVEHAIIAGDARTGVSIMAMDAGLDTGPVYLQRCYPITASTAGGALESALAELGADALLETLARLDEPGFTPAAQDERLATYAPKLGRDDASIDWSREATSIERRIRALNPRLPATTFLDGTRIRLLEASVVTTSAETHAPPGTILATRPELDIACGEGILRVTQLQLARGSGRVVRAREALNGYADLLAAGHRFAGNCVDV